jgi:hypothetical protein
MACTVTKSKGLTLSYADAVGFSSPTTLGSIVDLKGFAVKGTKEECTTYGTSGVYSTFAPGFFSDIEDAEVQLLYNKSNTTSYVTLKDTVKFWRVTYSDGSYWQVEAWLSDFTDETPLKGQITSKIKLMATGAYIVWTPAA